MNFNVLSDLINYLSENEYAPNTSGGNEASLGIPYFIKGITFNKYALAYNINKWGNGKKGCNLHSPNIKYLGNIPNIGEISELYYYYNNDIACSKLLRLETGDFEIVE